MRPTLFLILAILGFVFSASAKPEPVQVTFDYVAKKAEERARKPFHSPRADLPAVLRQDNLDYDKYREIEFIREKALWFSNNVPFRIEFFHPGYLYQEPVHISEFALKQLEPIPFRTNFFNYRSLKIQKQIPTETGYAGFRVLHPLNETNKWDEIGSFLGASYFRVLGKGQRYGLSARGLAIDCGGNGPEEFPIFTDWWLGKPKTNESQLRLFAILDSVSCAGAYEFLIRPGENTIVDVEAVLYFRETNLVAAVDAQRKPIQTIGLAPLTSMFWFGKSSERRFNDYRPEVHDSDGLLMQMENGERLWRPLVNGSAMRHQQFATKNIRGFGLLQRERNFAAYQDQFNYYHLTPSVWVQPHGDWGEGEVHLVELNTHYEGLDNIVAFWNPKTLPPPMQPLRFGYTLNWTREADIQFSPDRAISTRVGLDSRNAENHQFVIDFEGPKLAALLSSETPKAVANCSDGGDIVESQVFYNPIGHSWRVVIKFKPKEDNKSPVDLRCTLQQKGENISETWTYHWTPVAE